MPPGPIERLSSFVSSLELFKPKHLRISRHPYLAYTTAFDKVVEASALDDVLDKMSPMNAAFSKRHWDAYQLSIADVWPVFSEKLSIKTQELKVQGTEANFADVAVSLLVDHSGSIVKDKDAITTAASATEFLVEALTDLGIETEVLGYTTIGWHGGSSRHLWKHRGAPKNPGRLCALLHIIWKLRRSTREEFCDNVLSLFFHTELGRENVDGEAIEWAVSRMCESEQGRKILIVISDAAPVDDATYGANGWQYMQQHFARVVQDTVGAGLVELAGFGVLYDVKNYYPVSQSATNVEGASEAVLRLLDDLFVAKG